MPRCCSSDQRLFYSTTGTPTCVNSNTDPRFPLISSLSLTLNFLLARSLPEVRGLNLSGSLQRQELNLVLESAAGEPELPTCEEYQVHKLGWVLKKSETTTTNSDLIKVGCGYRRCRRVDHKQGGAGHHQIWGRVHTWPGLKFWLRWDFYKRINFSFVSNLGIPVML